MEFQFFYCTYPISPLEGLLFRQRDGDGFALISHNPLAGFGGHVCTPDAHRGSGSGGQHEGMNVIGFLGRVTACGLGLVWFQEPANNVYPKQEIKLRFLESRLILRLRIMVTLGGFCVGCSSV